MDFAVLLFILLVLAVCVEAYMTTHKIPARKRTWPQVEGDPVSKRIGLLPAALIVIIGGGFVIWVLGAVSPVTPFELAACRSSREGERIRGSGRITGSVPSVENLLTRVSSPVKQAWTTVATNTPESTSTQRWRLRKDEEA